MRVRFWGTRGSIPKPGPTTVRYGGNTSCVEVRTSRGTLIVLDCGTGAASLGNALLAEKNGPRRGHLLIGHTHWDHIQGLPFMAPLFNPAFEWDVYGPRGLAASIRDALAGQMQYTYFPVGLEQLAAKIRYHDLVEGRFTIDDVTISAHYMNHPALTLGYRLEGDGAILVYATDHEPHTPELARGERSASSTDEQRYVQFIADADLLIHDTHYILDEYEAHIGWGHSPVEFAVDSAASANVRRLALFHHSPSRTDDELDQVLTRARQRAAVSGLEVLAAAEGMVLDVEAGPENDLAHPRASRSSAQATPTALEGGVLLAVRHAEAARVVSEAVNADGLPLLRADDANSLLRLASSIKPSAIIVQRDLDGRDALALAPALIGPDPSAPDAPVVVVVALNQQEVDTDAGVRAGISDWLLWPFTEAYARARVHCSLLRLACQWSPAPVPTEEGARLRALHRLHVLDTPPEERFDRFTRIAAALFDVPVALVTLVDENRQWCKSHYGMDLSETPREMAFCAHAILGSAPMQVPDALRDARFADNPLVTGPTRLRFYAGVPLRVEDGRKVGTLCLIDHRARELDDKQLALLSDLGALVERELGSQPVE